MNFNFKFSTFLGGSLDNIRQTISLRMFCWEILKSVHLSNLWWNRNCFDYLRYSHYCVWKLSQLM